MINEEDERCEDIEENEEDKGRLRFIIIIIIFF